MHFLSLMPALKEMLVDRISIQLLDVNKFPSLTHFEFRGTCSLHELCHLLSRIPLLKELTPHNLLQFVNYSFLLPLANTLRVMRLKAHSKCANYAVWWLNCCWFSLSCLTSPSCTYSLSIHFSPSVLQHWILHVRIVPFTPLIHSSCGSRWFLIIRPSRDYYASSLVMIPPSHSDDSKTTMSCCSFVFFCFLFVFLRIELGVRGEWVASSSIIISSVLEIRIQLCAECDHHFEGLFTLDERVFFLLLVYNHDSFGQAHFLCTFGSTHFLLVELK